MRKVLMFVFAASLALFAVAGASAQTLTTGSMEGTVTDQNGAVVPGVNVTVTRRGGSPVSATTDGSGNFRILNIEPGMYTVALEEQKGFAKFERADVPVSLGSTSAVSVQLNLAGASAVVDVTASSGAGIDVTQTTTGTNVTTEQFSNFPTQRTVQSLYTIAPTVARSGLRDSSGRDRDPSVGGSSGPENNYILDGVTVTDPAFGGSGANLPFEFVQELEIKTGAYGAEHGKSTGGIFNVITKSGTNSFHGDVFGYFTTKGLVRSVKPDALPFTGAAPSGFSEIDAGVDIGGPIVKDKLWFFAAFNPQQRKNYSLTQTFLVQVSNKVTTPFYAGKLTWAVNQNHRFNFSHFADYTKQEGHLAGFNGFGANVANFRGTTETGGSNYAFRLNSTFTPTFIGEFSFGLHFQRANTTPEIDETSVIDRFAVLRGGAVVTPVETTVVAATGLRLAYVEGTGGTVQRNFARSGFGGGLQSQQDRDRIEFAARFQNIWGRNTVKYGFEWTENRYKIDTKSTGPNFDFTGGANPPGPYRIENRFAICARTSTTTITCPDATRAGRVQDIINAGQGPAGATTAVIGAVSASPTNPFLLLDTVRARDFSLNTQGEAVPTRTESFYIQDDFKVTRNFQLNIGLRWDFQQAYSTSGVTYFKLNNFKDNLQPRMGMIWDFTGEGRGKLFINYARYLETPIPLDVNIRASGGDIQNDFHLNASRINGGGTSIANFGNLGNHATPFDFDIKPQTVNEATAGIEWSPARTRDLTLGFRGIYRAQGSVIEDGSFDDGTTYFIFNPGESETERLACADPTIGCFGRARRYYRALEFTATKRFSNNYQFIASYVYSSLIGNYEGLFRNDNGQSDPNITSLFDLVSLLQNMYGRLPNDRPHQLKLNSSYRTPFKLLISGNFYAQSGMPFNQLIPHFLYGDNEGFGVQRGTAINPFTGSNRTPTTYNLDLGAYYPISVGEDKELRLSADWFNVFNAQRAIRQDDTFQINSGSPGIAAVPNPFYGNGTIFQFPSALRLGVKFTF